MYIAAVKYWCIPYLSCTKDAIMLVLGKIENSENKFGTINSEKTPLIFAFDNDNELQSFIERLVTKPVLTNGMRVITLLPPGMPEGHPVVDIMLRIINSGDGLIEGKGITGQARASLPSKEAIKNISRMLKKKKR